MTNEEKLSKALQDFKTKYPSITSADLQTFILGWQEAVKNCFIPDVMLSLPSQEEIDEQIDKYAFRVPYDGSNNFYDDVALKHYKAGIEWLLGRIRGNGA